MSEIVVNVRVDNLIARLAGLSSKMHASMLRVITRLSIDLQRHVMADKLSGQVLGVRTDVLRSSISYKVDDRGSSIGGVVGTNIWYGRLWENGFDRRVGAGAGGGVNLTNANDLTRYIAAHPQAIKHFPPRSFLATALADYTERIQTDIKRAAREVIKA